MFFKIRKGKIRRIIFIPIIIFILLIIPSSAYLISGIDVTDVFNPFTKTRDYITGLNQSLVKIGNLTVVGNITTGNLTTDWLLIKNPCVECPANSFMVYSNGTTCICVTPTNESLWNKSGVNIFNREFEVNVGINTTNPASTLTVQGTLNVSGNLSGTSALFVSSTGNVGINTNSPTYLLQVASGNDGRNVNLSNFLYVNGTNGRVGIGTNNATVVLDVRPASTGGTIYLKSTSGNGAGIAIERTDGFWGRLTSGTTAVGFLFENAGAFAIGQAVATAQPTNDGFSSTTIMAASSNGIMIGNFIKSTEDLEIKTPTPEIRFNNTNGPTFFDIGVSGTDFKIFANDTSPNGILINPDGKVGIGVVNGFGNMSLKVAGDTNVTGTLHYGALVSNSPHAFLGTDGGRTEMCLVADGGEVVLMYLRKVGGFFTWAFEENALACTNKEIVESIIYEFGYKNITIPEVITDSFLDKPEEYIYYNNITEKYIISQTEIKKKVFK